MSGGLGQARIDAGLPDAPELPGFDDSPALGAAANDTPPLRIFAEDGTLHYTDLKRVLLSGRKYLFGLNKPTEPTSRMLLGTAVHVKILGPRPGAKPMVVFEGKQRRGKEWDLFKLLNEGSEIITAAQWELAERMAESVRTHPVARARLDGARYEVPLAWEESGFRCSTSGIDIISGATLADLKTSDTTEPEAWQRHAEKMLYHCQMAWYRRGAIANGIDCSRGLFVLGVETRDDHDVVELEMTEERIEAADRLLTLMLERLRGYVLACPEPRAVADWPGYSQSSVPWELRPWQRTDVDEDDEAEATFEDEEAA